MLILNATLCELTPVKLRPWEEVVPPPVWLNLWVSRSAISWISESSIDPVELRQLEFADHTKALVILAFMVIWHDL